MGEHDELRLRRSLSEALGDCVTRLQGVNELPALMEAIQPLLQEHIGYNNVWLYLYDANQPDHWQLISSSGSQSAPITQHVPTLAVDGDPMLKEIRLSSRPVTVWDARVDPRTDKEIVATLGNRSIVNIRLTVEERFFGALGTGSFGDEPLMLPDAVRLEWLTHVAAMVAPVVEGIFLARRNEQLRAQHQELDRQLQRVQEREILGILAGGVAHDFNNLLTSIRANASALNLLLDGNPDTDDLLCAILEATHTASTLTRQLLDLARERPPVLEPADPNELIRQVGAFARNALTDQIELHLHESGHLPTVLLDPSRVQHALLNLVLNARDAIAPERGTITLATARTAEHVVITVADTGGGMDTVALARALTPFYTTKAHGTGLGLPMVQRCAEDHSGRLDIRSTPGEGTHVSLCLPISEG